MSKDKIIMYAPEGELQDSVRSSGVLDISNLSRKQTKELAKTAAGWTGEDGTFSWRDVTSGQAEVQGKSPRQEKRFKRIFDKQLSENLSPILERQHKQELIDRMKSGDASAMSQWTTEGIDKFGHQFMPVVMTAATLPFGIGGFGQAINNIGLLPAVGAEIGSWGLGYGGYKLGSYLDDDFGTKWIAPTMSIAGGFGGYGAGYKGMVKAGSKGWLPKGDTFMYGSQFVGDVAADGIKRGIRTTPEVPTIDRTVGIQNRVFTGDPVFPKTTWQIPADNTSSAYRLTGQSQIDDMMQTGYVRPRFGKMKGGHTNEVHWSAGNAKSGYNIQPGQYVLESQRGLVDGTSSAIGVNDLSHVWTVRNGQVVDVIDEVRPHMITAGSPSSSKGAYTFYERPSTYFKGATYAGTPGTYAGKEVPAWQLPKGQRNQPYNPTATEQVFSVLGRDPNVPTGGISDPYAFEKHRSLQPMYNFLKQYGVNIRNITLGDLDNLYTKRLHAIRSTSNNNYNVAIPDGISALPSNWKILGYDPEGLVGEMSFTGPKRFASDVDPEWYALYRQGSPGASIKMVRNTTRPDGAAIYDPTVGWIQTTDVTRSPVSGVSQRLYDAGIPTAQQTNNGSGLMSGELYLQARRSTAVMEHYPTKKIIRNDGTWNWEDRDPVHATTWNNPVYLLTQPSGRYTHIPTKSTSFFPSVIKDGQITTNVNHGSIFLEDGGKIENPDH